MFWIAAAVVVSALALVLQAATTLGVYLSVKKLQQEVVPLVPQVKDTLDQARKTMATSLEKIEQLSAKAHTALDSTNRQLAAIDVARQDVTVRVQAQLERLEIVLDDSMSRVQDVVTTVHRGVLRPVRELAGITAGIRAAIQALARGNRPSVAQATHDDEMFI